MATQRTMLPGTGYGPEHDRDPSDPHPVRDNEDDASSRSH
jgi:hypothetical protein